MTILVKMSLLRFDIDEWIKKEYNFNCVVTQN